MGKWVSAVVPSRCCCGCRCCWPRWRLTWGVVSVEQVSLLVLAVALHELLLLAELEAGRSVETVALLLLVLLGK